MWNQNKRKRSNIVKGGYRALHFGAKLHLRTFRVRKIFHCPIFPFTIFGKDRLCKAVISKVNENLRAVYIKSAIKKLLAHKKITTVLKMCSNGVMEV